MMTFLGCNCSFFLKRYDSLLQIIQFGAEFAGACCGTAWFCFFSFRVFFLLSFLFFTCFYGNIASNNEAGYCNDST